MIPRSLTFIRALVRQIKADAFGTAFGYRVARDAKQPKDGRIFVQVIFSAKCNVTGELKSWHGRKWYLSDHMTDDEVVKTCYAAFEAAVKHEVMEGFTFAGERVFNPHADFRALIAAGRNEVKREEPAKS